MVSRIKRTARKVWRFFFPVITYHWSVVRPMGVPQAGAFWLRYKNGYPADTGWFVDVFQCDDQQQAEELAERIDAYFAEKQMGKQ